MITKSFPSKRKPRYPITYGQTNRSPHHSAFVVAAAAARKITVDEYLRRENIVKELAGKIRDVFTGDTMYPCSAEGYEQYGAVKIRGVVTDYRQIPPGEEWPASDSPMIVSFSPLNDPGMFVNCTVNYLSKVNTHVCSC